MRKSSKTDTLADLQEFFAKIKKINTYINITVDSIFFISMQHDVCRYVCISLVRVYNIFTQIFSILYSISDSTFLHLIYAKNILKGLTLDTLSNRARMGGLNLTSFFFQNKMTNEGKCWVCLHERYQGLQVWGGLIFMCKFLVYIIVLISKQSNHTDQNIKMNP